MQGIQQRKFSSFPDFFRRFFGVFSGATFAGTLRGVPHRMREKILLTVSMANNCLA